MTLTTPQLSLSQAVATALFPSVTSPCITTEAGTEADALEVNNAFEKMLVSIAIVTVKLPMLLFFSVLPQTATTTIQATETRTE